MERKGTIITIQQINSPIKIEVKEQNLENIPEFAKKYKSIVKDYTRERACSKTNTRRSTSVFICNKQYVFNHGVTYVNKPGKVKVVFDAVVQFINTSLN